VGGVATSPASATQPGLRNFEIRHPKSEIVKTPVGFAALAHTRCALIGQFNFSIKLTVMLR
jgi:hypothetical protein